jgi:hypothetical protein
VLGAACRAVPGLRSKSPANPPGIQTCCRSSIAGRREGGSPTSYARGRRRDGGLFLYYVMPYVEGETLAKPPRRERQLPGDVDPRLITLDGRGPRLCPCPAG